MYQGTAATGLPVTGAGIMAYSSTESGVSAFIMMLAAFTLIMAAKAVWRMVPVMNGGDVRD